MENHRLDLEVHRGLYGVGLEVFRRKMALVVAADDALVILLVIQVVVE